jgi:hypothetical protein
MHETEAMVGREALKGRKLKQRVGKLLDSHDVSSMLTELHNFPARRVINSLFSFLYHSNGQMKWHAVTVMGILVAELAEHDMESARIILRRLMWNLNDESGGIGWGSAEAMGEILANHKGLATEYASILISYIRQDGNFQENELVQRGVLWGIARLAQARPELALDAVAHVVPFLSSPDPEKRGLAVRIIALLRAGEARDALLHLRHDESEFFLYLDGSLLRCSVSEMAQRALEKKPPAAP